ncbi:N-acetylmuramoyl-L-alanine amidase [Paenibacillus cellulosilyticus]|uniref:N-acetylmuramoyl-L-alanine amidase n=1 Tax=Paenibacillus cellulosilyticus TaxID=375489 RepID=A0A2V2YZQ0_9BACL|nr:N-acetylmuramoyl-L-alanine amidase family protein [Paenibacillus cellulosilyticus]PWW05488.1 N-acetylmuramoyl-L-alanine amidase [Paenibacillus cellulosilyticus]QKS45472.1 N-acetylmuramoyl-L-alanine amidase [Paenibacillus cellulosilyticus]
MRKLVVVIMLLSLFFSLFPAIGQAASVAPKLYLNGKLLETQEDPQIVDKSTLVPVRVVAEGLGYDVGWNQEEKRIDIQDDSNLITLTVDSRSASVNGTVVQLEAAAMIINKVTMVPIRFVAESLGLQVYYDSPTKSVHLYQRAGTSTDSGSSSGSDNSNTGNSSGSSNNNSTDSNTSLPAGVQGLLKSVQFDGMSSVLIDYDGTVTPNKAFTLTAPDRIVIDLPNSAFASTLTPGQVVVDSHPTLTKIRYAVGPDSPTTLRVVLDLKAASSYNVSEESGRIKIDVLDPAVTPPETTTPSTPSTSTGSSDKVYKVVIDAGHGGKDPGASTASGLYEKTFNLSIVLKVKELLDKESRIQATYTRTGDTYPTLQERVDTANKLKADAFISIHANSYTATTNGTETYYNRADSKPFATIMHKYLVKATGLKDNGVRFGDFKVIRETTMPAILLESGYLTNATDAKALFDSAIQSKIAAAIVSGLKEQLKLQ